MSMKPYLIKFHWLISSQFGFDPLLFIRSLRGFPKFLADFLLFRKIHSGSLVLAPCLHDRYEESGATGNEYFWQDLIVARWICEAAPAKHVDIGSRVDGFVAHVASFRDIEVFDIRPTKVTIPGVLFRQADLMSSAFFSDRCELIQYCDSVTCLHALEHFGLGRYGDSIDPQGYQHGIKNMARLLTPGGTFYLSTPIGKERVEFNSNWVFDPRTIIATAQEWGLKLTGLTVVSLENGPQESATDQPTLQTLAEQPYHLGIFTFTKANSP